jgi:hypothetical protein
MCDHQKIEGRLFESVDFFVRQTLLSPGLPFCPGGDVIGGVVCT